MRFHEHPRITWWAIVLFSLTLSVIVFASMSFTPYSYAETSDNWVDEFDDLCMQVQVADSMSKEEVEALIARVDKLMPIIQSSENPKKKVYIFRLKKCRSFFEYIIELKNRES